MIEVQRVLGEKKKEIQKQVKASEAAKHATEIAQLQAEVAELKPKEAKMGLMEMQTELEVEDKEIKTGKDAN